MLAMAAAYVRDPRLVLVDEASLGLAPLVVDEIFGFLQRLTTEGSSLLDRRPVRDRALSMAQTAIRSFVEGKWSTRARPRIC